jgi:hypothetical protein
MKRKKLELHRDTVRNLDVSVLTEANGGGLTFEVGCASLTCNISCITCFPQCTLSPTRCVPTVCTL